MKRPVNQIPAQTLLLDRISVEGKPPSKQAIEALANEIKVADGMVYPIVVQRLGVESGGAFRLRAGRKRYEAAKLLGWREIQAIVIPYINGHTAETISEKFLVLIEKLQRQELSDYDLARHAVEMKDRHKFRIADYAAVLGLSASYTYNLTRWYSTMPAEIRDAWKKDHPSISQAELECMSHMPPNEILPYFHKRTDMRSTPEPFSPHKKTRKEGTSLSRRGSVGDIRKPRRASEAKLIKLMDAIDEAPLQDAVKNLCRNILKYALGATEEVPGITSYHKLPKEILSREALKEASTTTA